jgi:hypothetical protein
MVGAHGICSRKVSIEVNQLDKLLNLLLLSTSLRNDLYDNIFQL